MIDERKFLELCKVNGVKPFKVTTELDDTDILIDTEDVNDFFDVCKCYGVKCVFYSYIQQTKENYELDKERLIKHIEEFVNSSDIRVRYNPFGFDDDVIDFEFLLEKYEARIEEIIEEQNKLMKNYKWGTPLMLEVFMSCNGDRIGITMFNNEADEKTELKWNAKLIEELEKELKEDIAVMYEENSKNRAEMREKELEETNHRYNEAIEEIKTILKTSEKLMECTNGKLRHAYARDLANDYSEKYDCYITIGEVDVFVDEEYKKRKNGK